MEQKKYYKILTADMIHHGFPYQLGLNTDTKPFNASPVYGGGLHFSDAEHIGYFLDFGCLIARVEIPEGEQMVSIDDFGGQYKAHSIILSEIHNLWTVEGFQWMAKEGIDFHIGMEFPLRMTASKGYLNIVKYLVEEQNCNIRAFGNSVLHITARKGYLHLVQYCVEKGANIHSYDEMALNNAIIGNHLDVVKYLVENDTDCHIDDERIRWTESCHQTEIAEYLRSLK